MCPHLATYIYIYNPACNNPVLLHTTSPINAIIHTDTCFSILCVQIIPPSSPLTPEGVSAVQGTAQQGRTLRCVAKSL